MVKKNNLSKKETDVLDFIKDSVQKRGFPPTVREICKELEIKSTSTTHAILAKLEDQKYIKKDPTLPRALKLLDNDDESYVRDNAVEYERSKAVEVPLVGQLAAGTPILAVENIIEYFPVPESFAGDRDVFLLRVRGDSMVNAGILNNDLILVARQNTAKNRDIVVALIGDEATVKTYYKENGHIRLQPENDYYEPIICTDDVMLLGKVVGVFRKL